MVGGLVRARVETKGDRYPSHGEHRIGQYLPHLLG
ncbi:Protein of unknown function [Pyronema omphalodes CBS 100304]|uniref:Uncharacterized protein n=1 Tax=Pyronema omphalodes (strain CBS 100304) TaxID=1076935 RepID=U4LVT4_PYROM|nr:Protein of unknown function [Pyronema omphalodes CBS 100304]